MTVQYKMFQSKSLNTSAIVLLCVFIFYFSCVSIYAIVKIEKLESDLNASKKIVEILNDFISDMTDAREYEEDYDEDDQEYDVLNELENGSMLDNTEDFGEIRNEINRSLVKLGNEERRKKREVIAATKDGVVIKSEPYAVFKKLTTTRNVHTQSVTPSLLKSTLKYYEEKAKTTPKPSPVMNRKSRVMKTDTKRSKQLIKKPMLRTLSDSQESEQEMTVIRDDSLKRRRMRPRLESMEEVPVRLSRLRPQPVIHFSGDTSKYVLGQHHNYKGNGHLRHRSKTFVDWKPEHWVKSLGMEHHFAVRDGTVTIKEPGLYFVYAQIYYLDEHDTNGFHVTKNNDVLLQCTTMTHSSERVMKGNTCYTGSVAYLSEDDRVEVRDISDARYSLFEPGKSFFGILKLGDIKMSN